jgi:hypothetical protein
MQEQVDAERVELGQEAHQVLQAAAEPIDGPSHHNVKLPLCGISAERIERRTLRHLEASAISLSGSSAADFGVLVAVGFAHVGRDRVNNDQGNAAVDLLNPLLQQCEIGLQVERAAPLSIGHTAAPPKAGRRGTS